ncbi:bifunctional 3'-5' exonuclease/DNA polymerase [Streptomyces sp. ACA25]|uniref:bifunctional 3'-5' exonuclease/DNA polymerase n=1 Tax=Streptomyces sp. ACA25 TaxID=3022596 RepID=UPI002307D5D9|nr:bifunctional 3'-5' exonuclease/DNA polymerase [Streptomyces sp. ACA25]MDB1089324.1 bifunctional 3'-5' exonuclease/DNA polymerase [Streptomyces sp. ACA25]
MSQEPLPPDRWALAEYQDGEVRFCPVDGRGRPAGPVERAAGPVEAVRSRPGAGRWIWRSTAGPYPRLLDAGLRVQRCYDIEAAEALLLGHEGAHGSPRSLPAARARLRGLPVPADAPSRLPDSAQSALFETGPVPLPPDADPLESLLEVYAAQLTRTELTAHPGRMRLLVAAESAGALVASEMRRAGLPWRADVHRQVLDELLGPRYAGGQEPRRLAELAAQVADAFGERVRPDLPADVVTAFRRAGFAVTSTRAWELRDIDHPAVEPLLEYKKLYRLYTAHGWTWLRTWVRGGRFRPEYVPAGAASGRWTTNGGGALQIPRVLRRSVVADPGWCLVVADADQLEPRVLAAISRDPGLMEAAGSTGDLYTALSGRAFTGDREEAKLALLGAVYGQTHGGGLRHLSQLRRRFPAAVALVDDAARAGEQGRLVRTWLGRTCPPPGGEPGAGETAPEGASPGGSAAGRARGRFTRNFVVQGSAADWALLMLAALRRSLTGMRAELVFFQHDEVIVHCPETESATVAEAIAAAGDTAGDLTFGRTPVRFPFSTAVVKRYCDAA